MLAYFEIGTWKKQNKTSLTTRNSRAPCVVQMWAAQVSMCQSKVWPAGHQPASSVARTAASVKPLPAPAGPSGQKTHIFTGPDGWRYGSEQVRWRQKYFTFFFTIKKKDMVGDKWPWWHWQEGEETLGWSGIYRDHCSMACRVPALCSRDMEGPNFYVNILNLIDTYFKFLKSMREPSKHLCAPFCPLTSRMPAINAQQICCGFALFSSVWLFSEALGCRCGVSE